MLGQQETTEEEEERGGEERGEKEMVSLDMNIDIEQLAEINLYLDQDSLLKEQEEQEKQAQRESEQQQRKEHQLKRVQLDRQDRYIKETLIHQISSKRKLTGKRLRV